MTYTPYLIPISVKGIIFENGRVWLRKNQRGEWELPGGKLDAGEQPVETVVRELHEELGFIVEATDLVQAHVHHIKDSIDEQQGVLILSYQRKLIEKNGVFEHEGEAGMAEFAAFAIDDVASLNVPGFYKEAISKAFELFST